MVVHLTDRFNHQRNRPTNCIHKIGKQTRFRTLMIIFNIIHIFGKFNYSSQVVVIVTVVWCWKYGNNSMLVPWILLITFFLNLMSSNNGNKFILRHEFICYFWSEKIRAISIKVRLNSIFTFWNITWEWVCPNQVTEDSLFGNFTESVNLGNIF